MIAAFRLNCLFVVIILASTASAVSDRVSDKPACVSIDKAKDFVGQEVCVVGEVHRVGFTDSGTALITFCDDYKKCAFSVVVFSRDVDKVGNLQMFEGRELEVTGKVREYQGTAEIVVKKRSQFSGEAVSLTLDRPDNNRNRQGRWHR
jgi:DNA/RNA endonuclease YhcR with UshA esterase domain